MQQEFDLPKPEINRWLQHSIDFANQRNYLDELYRVYPTIPDGIREIEPTRWGQIEKAFEDRDNSKLLELLLSGELFPIKDSYVAYLKRDPKSILRNPATVDRLCGRLYEMGLTKILEKSTEPKETNRQIGPMFKNWVQSGVLGIKPVPLDEFMRDKTANAILLASDAAMMEFAAKELNYRHTKGLDFVARFNKNYVLGEAKFLTDFGGHQNAQFADGLTTLKAPEVNAIMIGIFDGVCYIPNNGKMYQSLIGDLRNENVMSALVLRDFLYQI